MSLARPVRWLHTYLSLIGCAALLFFAVSGLTLNHAAFFESGGEQTRSWSGQVPRELLPAGAEFEARPLVEWLHSQAGLRGALHDLQLSADELELVLKGPGYSADARIQLASGTVELSETRLNAWARLNDLHKGRDSGDAWSVLIDVSAVLLALSGLSGMWLLLYVHSRRFAGLLVSVIGLLVMLLVGWLWVP